MPSCLQVMIYVGFPAKLKSLMPGHLGVLGHTPTRYSHTARLTLQVDHDLLSDLCGLSALQALEVNDSTNGAFLPSAHGLGALVALTRLSLSGTPGIDDTVCVEVARLSQVPHPPPGVFLWVRPILCLCPSEDIWRSCAWFYLFQAWNLASSPSCISLPLFEMLCNQILRAVQVRRACAFATVFYSCFN